MTNLTAEGEQRQRHLPEKLVEVACHPHLKLQTNTITNQIQKNTNTNTNQIQVLEFVF